MHSQIDKRTFEKALVELGHDPKEFASRRLTLEQICETYALKRQDILDAIDDSRIKAHYDYENKVIWVDALESAYFYFCLKNQQSILQLMQQ